jgi:hypothetical protein
MKTLLVGISIAVLCFVSAQAGPKAVNSGSLADVGHRVGPSDWLNALTYPGVDIGAKVNAAFASFAKNSCGTVYIPAGTYSYSTDIRVPNPACVLRGAGRGSSGYVNTLLKYAGKGNGIFVQGAATGSAPYTAGLLEDFTLVGANSAGNCADGIRLDSMNGYHIRDVEVSFFAGTAANCGGKNSSGILATDHQSQYAGQFEGYYIEADLFMNKNNFTARHVDGNKSFEHGTLDLYVVLWPEQNAISAENGAFLARGIFRLNGNVSHNGALVHVGSGSTFYGNVESWVENTDSKGAYLFKVDAGASCIATGIMWSGDGHLANSGCAESGDVTGYGNYQAQSLTLTGDGGITTFDRGTHLPVCIYVERGAIRISDGACK